MVFRKYDGGTMMKTTWTSLVLVASMGAAGCMTYDFEPVEPLAISQTTQARNVIAKDSKPNIMILLDKSGSMGLPINPSGANCTLNCGTGGNPCPPNCDTRISDLRKAMDTFLTSSANVARLGLFAYPTDTVCGDTTNPAKLRVDMISTAPDLDAELQMKSAEVNESIQRISALAAQGSDDLVVGGTPTGGSLLLLADYPQLNDKNRQNFVLLLTDGLPNCNAANPSNCTNGPAACQCTLASCGTSTGAQFCTTGCLDGSGVAEAVRELTKRNIQTIVVGFGADTGSGNAPAVLNSVAEAGGFARRCSDGCGADGCSPDGTLCNTKYYQASNNTELATALANISNRFTMGDPCVFDLLAQPADPSFLTVIIDDVSLNRGDATWTFETGKVQIRGEYCERIKNATPLTSVNVVIRIIEKL